MTNLVAVAESLASPAPVQNSPAADQLVTTLTVSLPIGCLAVEIHFGAEQLQLLQARGENLTKCFSR
jgi:hypothetical protein